MAPANWQEDPATRKIVDEKLKDPKIKSSVEKALKKDKEFKENKNNSQNNSGKDNKDI